MLTADHVRAFRRNGELKLSSWRGDARERAETLAASYLVIAEDQVGATRGELMEAFDDIPVGAREKRIADGLKKLVLDRCEFELNAPIDPPTLRQEVFELAAIRRSESEDLESFSREAVLEEVAAKHEVDAAEIERLLYADLKKAHRLLSFDPVSPETLMRLYDDGQLQGVLLKAEKVKVELECASPAAYRQLFRKLKFHRLLYSVEALEKGYRLTIEGPFAMFSSSTKYGLQLAMIVPAIRACQKWVIEATVRWGKDRSRVTFKAAGKLTKKTAQKAAAAIDESDEELLRQQLPDDVAKLLGKFEERFATGKSKWEPQLCGDLFHLPGVGVVVPDLLFTRSTDGITIYLEVLSFWSRSAVWKRVELVEKGLEAPVLFAVPSRLRVSEEVLPEDLPSALYVYKGVLSPKQIDDRLKDLAAR